MPIAPLQILHRRWNWKCLALEFISAVLDPRLQRNGVCKMLRENDCESKILRIPYSIKLSFQYKNQNDSFRLRRIK